MRPNVVQKAGQLSLPHVEIRPKTERNRTTNIKPMSSSYNTRWIKHKLVVSIYSNTETSLALSTLAIWCRVVQSRDVSPHNFDGLTMSGLAFSVAPFYAIIRDLLSPPLGWVWTFPLAVVLFKSPSFQLVDLSVFGDLTTSPHPNKTTSLTI